MRALLIVLWAMALLSCSSPTGDQYDKDAPLRSYELDSIGGKTLHSWDLPSLWEGEDGAKFQITGGTLSCSPSLLRKEEYIWMVRGPPDPETGRTGTLAYGTVSLAVVCEAAGRHTIRVQYPITGELLAADVSRDQQGCFRLTKQMPSEETLRQWADWDEIPSYVVFPHPMPVAIFHEMLCPTG